MAIRTFIADDNAELVEMLSDVLMQNGKFDVVGLARDGVQTLEGVRQCTPDLLLLDIIMPQMDGMTVLERLDMPNRPRIVMFSALGQDRVTLRALELGADAYFVKPFDFDVLVDRLVKIMGDAGPPAGRETDRAWENKAAQALHEMAVPPHIKGYRYLLTGIVMVLEAGGVIRDMTGHIYPTIAEKYETTPGRVERMMRHAVECAWNRSSAQRIEQVFGYTVDMEKSKPSNSEFIAMLADRILLGRLQNEKIG